MQEGSENKESIEKYEKFLKPGKIYIQYVQQRKNYQVASGFDGLQERKKEGEEGEEEEKRRGGNGRKKERKLKEA